MDNYYIYKTLEGDTWDSIALDFYDSEYYVTELMNANKDHIKTLLFDANVELKIPIIEKQDTLTLPPWKRS
jgi:hypothetical protein